MPRPQDHVLAVAFRPFGGRRRNESDRALASLRLPRALPVPVRTLVLPVSWRRGLGALAKALSRPGLRAVVLTGEAGRRPCPTPEGWGRNRARPLRDEDGRLPPSPVIARAGAVRRRATWDPLDVVRVLRRAGVPARASRDAGGFLCNAALYVALEHPAVRRRRVPVTFLHLPVPGAGARRDMTPARLARAVRALVVEAARRAAPGATPAPRRRARRR
jgi:pyroglutamyl-peptidase